MGADLYGVDQTYFRDSYNCWNVLWQFGLSWWQDVMPLLDQNRLLQPKAIVQVLGMLSDRERVFLDNVADLPEDRRKQFTCKREELYGFLRQALPADAPIECSL